jgi:hypothetical protein
MWERGRGEREDRAFATESPTASPLCSLYLLVSIRYSSPLSHPLIFLAANDNESYKPNVTTSQDRLCNTGDHVQTANQRPRQPAPNEQNNRGATDLSSLLSRYDPVALQISLQGCTGKLTGFNDRTMLLTWRLMVPNGDNAGAYFIRCRRVNSDICASDITILCLGHDSSQRMRRKFTEDLISTCRGSRNGSRKLALLPFLLRSDAHTNLVSWCGIQFIRQSAVRMGLNDALCPLFKVLASDNIPPYARINT